MTPRTVLIVDDEPFVRESLVALLEAEGFRTWTAADRAGALDVLGREPVDAVVSDLQMPGGDGVDVLEAAREVDPAIPVVLITGVGTVEDAVRAMKAGAVDFLRKPVEPEQFVHVVSRAIERRDLLSEVERLRNTVEDLRGPDEMVGASAAIGEVRDAIARVAPSDATVLVTGESGTGKNLVARAIHRASDRADGPLVAVNCAAIPESLFESELFGHRRGAFTGAAEDRAGRFAEAHGGTLVLDEIGTLRPALQAKLLGVLESGEYQVIGDARTRVADVRVIAVTNEDLPARVEEGAFRSDLYYRLAIFPIDVPPLRDRREDIAPLAAHFLRAWGRAETLDDAALGVLGGYDWPGNIRELRNILERSTLLAGPDPVDAERLRRLLGATATVARAGAAHATPAESAADDAASLHIRERTEALERDLIRTALTRSGGRKKEAAELLGIDPRNLAYHLRKHGIEAP